MGFNISQTLLVKPFCDYCGIPYDERCFENTTELDKWLWEERKEHGLTFICWDCEQEKKDG